MTIHCATCSSRSRRKACSRAGIERGHCTIGFGSYYSTFWEDELGYRSRRDVEDSAPAIEADVPDLQVPDSDPRATTAAAAYVVDLDREAGAEHGGAGRAAMDYDVS